MPLMGFLGLFSAPLAFEASRVLHKGTLEALEITGTGGDDLSPLLVAAIKGIESGCLGLLVGWVSQHRWGGAAAHAAVGLLVVLTFGVTFGGTEIALAAGATPQPAAADLFTESINEVLFPSAAPWSSSPPESWGSRRRTRTAAERLEAAPTFPTFPGKTREILTRGPVRLACGLDAVLLFIVAARGDF